MHMNTSLTLFHISNIFTCDLDNWFLKTRLVLTQG